MRAVRAAGPIADLPDGPLLTARNLRDYERMFLLEPADRVLGTVLDCPGGASSFSCEWRAGGGRALAADPLYELPRDRLAGLGAAEIDRAVEFVRARPQLFTYTDDGPLDTYRMRRSMGLERFLADFERRPDDYVAATLPALPFEDGRFALTLSSHLLFTYADRLDREFHLVSVLELARVTAGELRLFPIVDLAARRYGELEWLRAELSARDMETERVTVPYESQRGGNEMLVCR